MSQALAALKEVLNEYKGEEISITVTGHSMGAAMVTLKATDIVRNGYNILLEDQPNKVIPVTAFVFACPRVGNEGFGNVFFGLENLHVLRVTNDQDIVPKQPDGRLCSCWKRAEIRLCQVAVHESYS